MKHGRCEGASARAACGALTPGPGDAALCRKENSGSAAKLTRSEPQIPHRFFAGSPGSLAGPSFSLLHIIADCGSWNCIVAAVLAWFVPSVLRVPCKAVLCCAGKPRQKLFSREGVLQQQCCPNGSV